MRNDPDTRTRSPSLERDLAVKQTDLSGIRREQPEHELERGALARPVRAEQAKALPPHDLETQSVDRGHAVERLAQPGHAQHGQGVTTIGFAAVSGGRKNRSGSHSMLRIRPTKTKAPGPQCDPGARQT